MLSITEDILVINIAKRHFVLIQSEDDTFVNGTSAVFYITASEVRWIGEAQVKDIWEAINTIVPNHIAEVFSSALITEVLKIYNTIPLV